VCGDATLLDAVGTPLGTVQALLGQSSSAITRDVYLHSIPPDARAAVQQVVPPGFSAEARALFSALHETKARGHFYCGMTLPPCLH
jgi:hypothetical protein